MADIRNAPLLRCRCKNKSEKKRFDTSNKKVEVWLNNHVKEDNQRDLPDYIKCDSVSCPNKKKRNNKSINEKSNLAADPELYILSAIQNKLELLDHKINDTNERLLKAEINYLRQSKKSCKCKRKQQQEQRKVEKEETFEPIKNVKRTSSTQYEYKLDFSTNTIESKYFDPYKVNTLINVNENNDMPSKYNVGFPCNNPLCDKTQVDCKCHGDPTDHTMICTMSCEITKLRKDVLDLKVMVTNCLQILETNVELQKPVVTKQVIISDSEHSDSTTTTKKRHVHAHKKSHCCKKKKTTTVESEDSSHTPPTTPPPDQKRPKCYLSRLCKLCCLKL